MGTEMTEMDAAFIHQIEAEDAWNLLSIDPTVALVDVRRETEVKENGRPDLSDLNASTWNIEWRCDRLPSIKAHFLLELEQALTASTATHLIFYCDDGRRALNAAQTVAGNLQTFDRPIDVSSVVAATGAQARDCWRDAGLPWALPNPNRE